jgi:hypothetical protein
VFEPLPSKAEPDAAIQRGWLRYEILLCLLGLYTIIALLVRSGATSGATLQAVFVTLGYVWIIRRCRKQPDDQWQKLRFLAGYLFVFWYFLAVAAFVPAIGAANRDTSLLAIDEQLFGVTPAVWMQSVSSIAMTELMSACYLSFVVYLHVTIVHALFMSNDYVRRYSNWIFSIYAIGLPGYLLVSATGPAIAFPTLFDAPLHGWLLTDLNQAVVERGSSVYSVFPSLHVLITFALLAFDRRHCPRRFQFMLLPTAGLIASTMYLRYHYAIDLLAGAAIFLIAAALFGERRSADVATGN